MMIRRFAVAPRDGDWEWVTSFYIVGGMWCSDPIREGPIDQDNYRYKPLTESEYETYLEMGALKEIKSSEFVLQGLTEGDKAEMEIRQEMYEYKHELDDVFDQSE